jgi:hypothetical protein
LKDWKLIEIQHTFQTKKQKIEKDVQGEEHLWKNTLLEARKPSIIQDHNMQ